MLVENVTVVREGSSGANLTGRAPWIVARGAGAAVVQRQSDDRAFLLLEATACQRSAEAWLETAFPKYDYNALKGWTILFEDEGCSIGYAVDVFGVWWATDSADAAVPFNSEAEAKAECVAMVENVATW